VLYPLWTAKPGSGCSTIALALSVGLAERHRDVLLVDLNGDLAAAAGLSDPAEGVTDWLAAPEADSAALGRLEVPIRAGVHLLACGRANQWTPTRGEVLYRLLRHEARDVVIDIATVERWESTAIQQLRRRVAVNDSLLVTRACYLALRRAENAPVRPSGVVLVREPGRWIDARGIERTLGAPVVAQIDHDPAIARAVDSGRLVKRLPRPLHRQVGSLAR